MNEFNFKARLMPIVLSLYTIFFLTGCLSTSEGVTLPSESMSIQELIHAGQTDTVRSLFQTQTDINMVDARGNTALHAAAQINDADLVGFLLYMGADSEIKNINGDTPLHVALKNAAPEAAKTLADLNSNIFAKDGNGMSAIEIALGYDELFYDALLTIQTGEIQDVQGKSIIHYLVKDRNITGIEYAIQKRLPLSVQDMNAQTPLALAYSQDDEESIEIAAALILANAAPERGEYSYFEDAIKTRNTSMRFDEGQTPLHFAAILGKNAIAKYLITQGASTKAKDLSGSTPLHEAVRYGYVELVRILLDGGADINARDSIGKTPLLIITPVANRNEIYELLLSRGANANATDSFGDNALHVATLTEVRVEVLEILASGGTDINERNKKGVTPLAQAVERRNTDHIGFFTSRNADIHAEDINGNTPFTRAINAGLEITEQLVNNENNSSRDSLGNTPLHIAVYEQVGEDQIQFLLDIGSDVNARNRNGDSPLYTAVQQNSRAIGEILLANGADVFSANTVNYSPLRFALSAGGEEQDWVLTSEVIKAADGIGNTPLHYAAEWQLDDALSVILEKGADPNVQNTNGESAIFNAIKADRTSTINLLLKSGADRNLRDYLGNTALHSCMRWDAKNAALLILSSGADINAQNLSGKTALHEVARAGRIDMVKLLLNAGANIHVADATGRTPLMDAVQVGNIDIASLLISRGASAAIPEMYGRNAYHEAAETGNIELIKLLREAGGNPLSRDTHGRTPLSLVLDKDVAVITAILGNDVYLVDSDGNTPIHIAVTSNVQEDILSTLIDFGYPVDRRNSEGTTPLLLAVKSGKSNFVQLLLQKGGDPFITDNSSESALSYALKYNTDMLNPIVQESGLKRDTMGETVLHYAARDGDIETVQQLLSMGLDRSIKNISGETAYDIAIRWKRDDIAALLK